MDVCEIAELCESLTKEDLIKWAVYVAEKVIGIYEEKYPQDPRPHNSILSAKRYLKNPTPENWKKCEYANTSASKAVEEAILDDFKDMKVIYAGVVARCCSGCVIFTDRNDAGYGNATYFPIAGYNACRDERILEYWKEKYEIL